MQTPGGGSSGTRSTSFPPAVTTCWSISSYIYLRLIGLLMLPVVLKVQPEVSIAGSWSAFEAGLGAVAAVTWRRYVLKQSGRSLVVGLISAATGVMCYLLGTSVWAYDAAARRSTSGTNATDSVWVSCSMNGIHPSLLCSA